MINTEEGVEFGAASDNPYLKPKNFLSLPSVEVKTAPRISPGLQAFLSTHRVQRS
jgi:hypothetical protein